MRKFILFSIMVFAVFFLTACSSSEESLVGTSAPDFTLENTQGGQTALSEFRGTPVLLFFHMAVG
jgi:cytochrome oxidase Cu insertion factor (SCO1/SenC/PrrC family)